MKRRRLDCRQCHMPMMEGIEGVVLKTGGGEVSGWCDKCLEDALPLIGGVARLAVEDLNFEDFIEDFESVKLWLENALSNSELDTLGRCPNCGDEMVSGSFMTACRKCTPVYFEMCECGQEQINCMCSWRKRSDMR